MNVRERFQDQRIDVEAARAVSIIDLARRYGVDLKPQGRDHFGLCPFHLEKSPSFSINEEKGLYHCFGCGANGDGIDLVMAIEGVEFRVAVERLTGDSTDPSARDKLVRQSNAAREEAAHQRAAEDSRKAKQALDIWLASTTAIGSAVETYFRSRNITIPAPPSLRYHAALKHGPTGLLLPAMVAALQNSDRHIVGIHRTYLLPDGRGKAPVSSPKMALGRLTGSAVRLAAATDILGLAEGIETGLSAMQLYHDPIWAACGSNMAGVVIPDNVKRVVVYADNGEAGERAAERAAEAFHRQGRKVTVVRPIDGYGDFNDYLQVQAEGRAA